MTIDSNGHSLKELIFDVDISDYKFRACNCDNGFCESCYIFLKTAIICMNFCLKKFFGFKNIIFINSGRRGIHCIILDDSVLALPKETRRIIAEFFDMRGKIGKKYGYIAGERKLDPAFIELYNQICPTFISKVLPVIKKESLLNLLKSFVSSVINDKTIFNLSELTVENDAYGIWLFVEKSLWGTKFKHVLIDIVFYFCFPILDQKVTEQVNHLIKMPFSLHPVTRNISYVIDDSRDLCFDDFSFLSAEDLIANQEKRMMFYYSTSIFENKLFF
jgi:DNA primase small subunit